MKKSPDDGKDGHFETGAGYGALAGSDVARRSVGVAGWTVTSRLTGLIRLALVAAILGPTYLGNTFQATNQVPTLTYQLVVGSLLTSLLVPPLVHCIDRNQPQEVERLAGSLLGLAMVAFAVVSVLLAAGAPLILRLLSAGVDDPTIAAAQYRAGAILLLVVLPQVVLYGVAAVGEAVMNAHGKFALAAAAPAFENLGLILTLIVNLLVFGSGVSVEEASTSQLLLLGLGATAGVGTHAGIQWWGARRVGVRLVPNVHWRGSEVRDVAGRALPMVGYAALTALLQLGFILVSNSVAGGVVAFQVCLQLMHFPVAITSRSVSVAVLPKLARLAKDRALQRFRDELVRAVSLSFFVAVPAAVAYVALATPIASAIAFGEMDTARGVTLLAVSLAALGPAVLGEAAFVLGTLAEYAREDTGAPFRAKLTGVIVTSAGSAVALAVTSGPNVLLILGLATSAGSAVGALRLARGLRASLPVTGQPIWAPLARAVGASLVMVVPAYAVAVLCGRAFDGQVGEALGVVAAVTTGIGTFIAVQHLLHSPELRLWASSFTRSTR